MGWECPTWGAPCNRICGNGFVEAEADGTLIGIQTGVDGITGDPIYTTE